MKKARENQATYLFLAIIMIPLGLYTNVPDIIDGRFPEGIMVLFLGFNALLMAYVTPHLFPKDERSKEIMGRSMSLNYFTLFGTILVLFLLTGPNAFFALTASQVLIILTCVMVTTIPLTMVVYSKII